MMEYTLKITVSPTIHEDTYAARIFISADDDTNHVDTEQIWETSLLALTPGETADPRMWALMLIREIRDRLEPDAWNGHIGGKAITMLDLFKPQGHYLM